MRAPSGPRTAIVLLALSAAACHSIVSSDAYPLYPKIDAGPGRGSVALLHGPIAIVDGHSVSGKGPTFELLPGCHLVALEPTDDKPPHIIFAFEMRPAYLYTVTAGADTGQARAPDGSVAPVRRASASDVTACREWAKAARY